MTIAYPTRAQTPPLEWRQDVQHLPDGMRMFVFESVGSFFRDERVGKYPAYRVDKGRRIIPTQIPSHLISIAVGEDVLDQGYAFARSRRLGIGEEASG